jgi:hypothetical protein
LEKNLKGSKKIIKDANQKSLSLGEGFRER